MSQGSLHPKKDFLKGFEFQKYLTPAVLLGLILLLGTALRFYDLGTESYWVDEIYTVTEGRQSIYQIITSGRFDQPPAYYLPFHFWVHIFGTAEVNTRSFSVLVGIGSIILIYLVGRNLFGEGIGLLSAFFMAISQFQLYYSQITRFYIFFEFTTLLSFLFFILALRRKKRIYFAAYVIASIFMVYSHTFGVFILGAQNLFFILQWKETRVIVTSWLICQTLILFAFLPYCFFLVSGNGGMEKAFNNSMGTPIPSLLEPLRSIYRFIFPARGGRSWGGVYALAGAFLIIGICIYAIRQGGLFIADVRNLVTDQQDIPEIKPKLLLLICWLLCPILLPFVLSFVLTPIYAERYTISASPSLYLVLALGIFKARRVIPIILSLGFVAIMIVPGLRDYYANDVNEQWKEAAEFVMENSEPTDLIIFAPNTDATGIEQRAFNWYYRGILPSCGISGRVQDPIAISDALSQCTFGHNRFWVISTTNVSPPNRWISFFKDPNRTNMRLIKEHQFIGIAVFLFEWTRR